MISLLGINPLWVIAVQICLHIWQVKLSNCSCKMLFGKMKRNFSPCEFQSLFSKTFLTEGESQVLPSLLLMQVPKKVPLPFFRWQKRHMILLLRLGCQHCFSHCAFSLSEQSDMNLKGFSFQVFYSSLSLLSCYQWGRKASIWALSFPFQHRPCCFRATLFCLRQSWGAGASVIDWRSPANRVKKQSPEMPAFPSKEGIMWMEVKITWVLFLAMVFVHLFTHYESLHSLFFMRVTFSMINLYVSLLWNLQICWRDG